MLIGIDILYNVAIKLLLHYLILMMGMSFMPLVLDDLNLPMSLLLMLHMEPVI